MLKSEFLSVSTFIGYSDQILNSILVGNEVPYVRVGPHFDDSNPKPALHVAGCCLRCYSDISLLQNPGSCLMDRQKVHCVLIVNQVPALRVLRPTYSEM